MRSRVAVLLLIALATVAVALPAPALGADPDPKVAVIVGPVGEATERYRERAESAIAEARRWTSNIAYVASPNATWPRVREALEDASIVIYLGHGNGWPSRYRDHLYPPTQNGFGLNPVAGVDDEAHQYFGESFIREEVDLAPNAVVLLHHLCYASGNTEPGLPEGTQQEARQRVDNYASGFIDAGAEAVVADAFSGPAHYVRALLGGNETIEEIWRESPTANGNTFGFQSVRSPGFNALMDPDSPEGDYYRSLVARLTLGADELRASAPADAAVAPATPAPTPEPTLADLGFEFGVPSLEGVPIATGSGSLQIPITTVPDGQELPDSLYLGVRWDGLEAAAPAEEPAAEASPEPSSDPSAPPDEGTAVPRGPRPATTPTPPPPEFDDPAAATFVVAERPSDVVTVVPLERKEDALIAKAALPEAPGLYRLVTTLHDSEAVAFDVETQALFSALVVRVQAPVSASYATPAHVDVRADVAFQLPVTVTNSGSTKWADPAAIAEAEERHQRVERPRLTATWMALGSGSLDGSEGAAAVALVAPADSETLRLRLVAPSTPGEYLIVLDVVTPDGSLTARGVQPGIVRVTVQ